MIHSCFFLPIFRFPFRLDLLSLGGSRACLLCSEREASDSSHFLTSFAQELRSRLQGCIDACDRSDEEANGASESRDLSLAQGLAARRETSNVCLCPLRRRTAHEATIFRF